MWLFAAAQVGIKHIECYPLNTSSREVIIYICQQGVLSLVGKISMLDKLAVIDKTYDLSLIELLASTMVSDVLWSAFEKWVACTSKAVSDAMCSARPSHVWTQQLWHRSLGGLSIWHPPG